MQNAECRTVPAECKMQDVDHRMGITERKMQTANWKAQNTKGKMQTSTCKVQNANCKYKLLLQPKRNKCAIHARVFATHFNLALNGIWWFYILFIHIFYNRATKAYCFDSYGSFGILTVQTS